MKGVKTAEATEMKGYEKPLIRSEKEAKELSFNCPVSNVRRCGRPFSPKKGS